MTTPFITAAGSRTRRYLAVAALAAFVPLLAVAAVNAVIDPFAMYRLRDLAGWNVYKPAVRLRLYKAYEVRRARPSTVVLGASTAHIALSCRQAALQALPGPCYNLAFDGATAKEMYAYLLHASRIAPLRTVVLALDVFHMVDSPSRTRGDFDPAVLYRPYVPHVVTWATGDLRLLTSIDTWRASLRTMRTQPGPDRPWFFTADGQRVGEYFFHASYPFMHDGPRAYFLQIDQNEIHDRVHAPAAVEGERTFDDLARIVDFCLANGIDLRVVLTPSHAHQFEISRLVGDWDTVLASKRKLLALLTAKAAERGTAAPPLWDFMRYTTVTTEDLPPEGSHDELSRYWDPTHYKQAVGDGLLDVVVGASYSGLPADAGVRLTPQTIDAVLAADLEASARYEAAHTADIDQLTGLVADRRRELGLDAPH